MNKKKKDHFSRISWGNQKQNRIKCPMCQVHPYTRSPTQSPSWNFSSSFPLLFSWSENTRYLSVTMTPNRKDSATDTFRSTHKRRDSGWTFNLLRHQSQSEKLNQSMGPIPLFTSFTPFSSSRKYISVIYVYFHEGRDSLPSLRFLSLLWSRWFRFCVSTTHV